MTSPVNDLNHGVRKTRDRVAATRRKAPSASPAEAPAIAGYEAGPITFDEAQPWTVERGVPLPHQTSPLIEATLRRLAVYDSTVIEAVDGSRSAHTLQVKTRYIAKRIGIGIKVQKLAEGRVRVWRTE